MENKTSINIILKELLKKIPEDKKSLVRMGIDAIDNIKTEAVTSEHIIETMISLNFLDIAHFLDLLQNGYTKIQLSDTYYFHIFGKLQTL